MEFGTVIAILFFVIVISALVVPYVQYHMLCEECSRLFAGKDQQLFKDDKEHKTSVRHHLNQFIVS